MTNVFFVRHAQPNFSNHNDRTRELTPKGMEDRRLVTAYFREIPVDAVLSSPFKRAIDTVKDLADSRSLPVITVEDFRERRVDSIWIEDFNGFCRRQWKDFDYKLSDGETLRQVQERNIRALNQVLREYRDKTVVIGSHGTALSTVINHFDPSFGYQDFAAIREKMPWIVKFTFEEEKNIAIEMIDLFP